MHLASLVLALTFPLRQPLLILLSFCTTTIKNMAKNNSSILIEERFRKTKHGHVFIMHHSITIDTTMGCCFSSCKGPSFSQKGCWNQVGKASGIKWDIWGNSMEGIFTRAAIIFNHFPKCQNCFHCILWALWQLQKWQGIDADLSIIDAVLSIVLCYLDGADWRSSMSDFSAWHIALVLVDQGSTDPSSPTPISLHFHLPPPWNASLPNKP